MSKSFHIKYLQLSRIKYEPIRGQKKPYQRNMKPFNIETENVASLEGGPLGPKIYKFCLNDPPRTNYPGGTIWTRKPGPNITEIFGPREQNVNPE